MVWFDHGYSAEIIYFLMRKAVERMTSSWKLLSLQKISILSVLKKAEMELAWGKVFMMNMILISIEGFRIKPVFSVDLIIGIQLKYEEAEI